MQETPESPVMLDNTRINLGGRELILIGTAHISRESVDTVLALIEQENPDAVCVELDEQRYQALRDKNRWESLNIFQVIKQGQAPFMLANLALSSFQKRMGLQTGVQPGAELAAAASAAEERSIPVSLIDRSIKTTLLRAWRRTGFWKKMELTGALFGSIFETQKIDEEELKRLRSQDTLSSMLEEMAEILPTVKTILVDERDQFMAEKIRQTQGEKIIAVVGAAHCPGIIDILSNNRPVDLDSIDTVPPKSSFSKAIPWLIPSIVMLAFILGFFYGDRSRMGDAALAWILANGIFASAGALIALGHPLTIATAFVAAPITSLNPTIGAGMVTGLAQAFLAKPTVGDLQSVGDDLVRISGWWSNRVARVLLVFIFSNLGSAIGTFVAFGWLKDLFT